jgi:short subunit dehydrogenase-like uncharacterized protein
MQKLMIYGANGYSGELIARAAKIRGMRPILAGRNAAQVQALGAELKFDTRVFALDQIDLSDIDVLLHCAGPFSSTAAPMLQACLKQRTHYLDITGEIDVFLAAQALHSKAQDAGIVICPGVGFDVVPTDCLALMLKQKMPDADQLVLAFHAEGGMSRGTTLTSIEGLKGGGRARIDGELRTVPSAWKVRDFSFAPNKIRRAMTIPWGDVVTAHYSTGIANIEVYMSAPRAFINIARLTRWLKPILQYTPLPALLKWRTRQGAAGPDAATRARSRTYVFGEVKNANQQLQARLLLPNGYELTVDAALSVAQFLLDGKANTCGYTTPSMLCGADFVLQLQNTAIDWSAS